jgi:hypothetical protein
MAEKLKKATSPKARFVVLPRMLSISETAWYMPRKKKETKDVVVLGQTELADPADKAVLVAEVVDNVLKHRGTQDKQAKFFLH